MEDYELIFNNKNCYRDLNICIAEYPSIPQTNEDTEDVEVEGMNGKLIIKKGTFPDKEIPFTFSMIHLDNFWRRIDFINEWLDDIKDKRLFYGRTDKCYIVKNLTKGDIEREVKENGTFNVTFLVEGLLSDPEETEIEITNNFSLEYLGTEKELPILEIEASGNIQIQFNDANIQINNVNGFVKINSKLKQFLNKDLTSKDMDSLGSFPILIPGTNTINWTGNISSMILKFSQKYR
ncbi:distal tail protein Dit [Clostridium sardiniense]|uniref:distal tail protein Dit n=1 Tax=Clostridium sardiniense TaxID=29369 RepID=UPI001957D829|nr:distal tail protein Dit [Clostridium sardiniense]MBM7836445.1 putative phage tail component-like protein [Clostridium sardiniense]